MNQNHRNQASNDTYQTGSTQPTGGHSGRWAILLVAAILMISITRTMGLFQLLQWQALNSSETVPSQFANLSATEAGGSDPLPPPAAPNRANVTVELEDAPTSADNIPQPGGLPLQEIYEKNIGSVVSITSQGAAETSTGTGVVVSSQGYIVTNCHVVQSAKSIEVLLTSGRTYPAAIVGTDPMTDLAVLYVENDQLIPATFCDSASLRVGDAVAAIGDPLGTELRGTLTDGILSAINRNISVGGRSMTLLQTNAALNSGNSGGPLLNCYGQVIGINTMKLTTATGSVEGIGFAIPSATVKEVVDQLICQGYVSGRPTLGITGHKVDPFYQIYYRFPEGLYITQAEKISQASEQMLFEGDILLSLNNTPITDEAALAAFLNPLEPGTSVTAKIYRSGRHHTLTLTVGETN